MACGVVFLSAYLSFESCSPVIAEIMTKGNCHSLMHDAANGVGKGIASFHSGMGNLNLSLPDASQIF